MTTAAAGLPSVPFDPMNVIRGFVQDPDPQRRLSAAIALRRIGTPEAAKELAEMVLREADRQNRDAIVHELVQCMTSLRDRGAADAWRVLLDHVSSNDAAVRQRTIEAVLHLHEAGAVWQIDADRIGALVQAATDTELQRSAPSLVRGAEEILGGLREPELLRTAASALATVPNDEQRRTAALLLLARLRRRGSPLPLACLARERERASSLRKRLSSWIRRLESAWMLADASDPPRLPSPYIHRSVTMPSLVFGLLGAALMTMALAASPISGSMAAFYPFLLLACVLLSLLFGLAATARSIPMVFYYDIPAGIVVAVSRAVFHAALLVTPIVLALMVGWQLTVRAAFALALICVAVVASVRLGTIAGFFALPYGFTRRRDVAVWPTSLLQLVAGAGAGIALLYGLRALAAWDVRFWSGQGVRAATEGLWLFMAPVCPAIAAALATADRPGIDHMRPPESASWKQVPPAMLALPLVVIAVAATIVGPYRFWQFKPPVPFALAAPGESRDLSTPILDPRRTELEFSVAFAQDVLVQTTRRDRLAVYYKEPAAVRGNALPDCTSSSPDEVISQRATGIRLQWGCYKVVTAATDDSVNRSLVMAVIGARVGSTGSSASDRVPLNILTATLNTSKEGGRVEERHFPDETVKLSSGTSQWLVPNGIQEFLVPDARSPYGTKTTTSIIVAATLPQGVRWYFEQKQRDGSYKQVLTTAEVAQRFPRALPISPTSLTSNPARPNRLELDEVPGTYRLRFARNADGVPDRREDNSFRRVPIGVSLTLQATTLLPNDKPLAVEADVLDGQWRFDHVPYVGKFHVPDSRRFTASVPETSSTLDLVLELWRSVNGNLQLVDSADDPEELERTLDAGDYELHVNELGSTKRIPVIGVLNLHVDTRRR